MKFDYYLLNSYVPELDGDGPAVYQKWIEQVLLAEELGFHCAWFTEHHFLAFGGMLPNPQLLMAALAQRTRTIHLGSAVSVLPLHNPIRIAEDMAMLDILSNGRIEVGLGRGMDVQYVDILGADRATAQEKFEEQLAMVAAAWTEEAFCWDGKFFQCAQPLSVLPKPVQQPHPPIWVPVGGTPEHSRMVGRLGYNLMTLPWYGPTFDSTRAVLDGYQQGLREGGHAAAGCETLGYFSVYVGETPERARADANDAWERHRQISDDQRGSPERFPLDYDIGAATGRAILGDPAMCRSHIQRIQDELGLDRLALRFDFGGLSQDRVFASMRLFTQEVAPAFADAQV